MSQQQTFEQLEVYLTGSNHLTTGVPVSDAILLLVKKLRELSEANREISKRLADLEKAQSKTTLE